MNKRSNGVTAHEMRRIDEHAIQEYGIPSLILMENAGIVCTREVLKIAKARKPSVAIFSGKGNNGGDGFVVARHLANKGLEPVVFFFQKPAEMKPDPLTNFRILEKMKVKLIDCSEKLDRAKVLKIMKKSGAIVDALFGTGLSKPIVGSFRKAIETINDSKLPVIAVDIPSGLNADTGEVMGVCVRAKVTVALGLPKKGFYLERARHFTGRIVIADISIPRELLEECD